MTVFSKESLLAFDCCRNRVDDVRISLEENSGIDTAYNGWRIFWPCNSNRKLLIRNVRAFYRPLQKTRLHGDLKSEEYEAAKKWLHDILYEEGNMPSVVPQIREMLDQYLNESLDTDQEFDLTNVDDIPDLPSDDSSHENEPCTL